MRYRCSRRGAFVAWACAATLLGCGAGPAGEGVGVPADGHDPGLRHALLPPTWGAGVTPPATIFTYYTGGAGRPAYCEDTAQLLNELDKQIGATSATNNCRSRVVDDLDGARNLQMWCTLRRLDNGCEDNYVATLWPERIETSTVRYEVKAVGWGRRVCPATASSTGVYDETAIDSAMREAVGQVSNRLRDFFRPCDAEPPTPATPSSAPAPGPTVPLRSP